MLAKNNINLKFRDSLNTFFTTYPTLKWWGLNCNLTSSLYKGNNFIDWWYINTHRQTKNDYQKLFWPVKSKCYSYLMLHKFLWFLSNQRQKFHKEDLKSWSIRFFLLFADIIKSNDTKNYENNLRTL